MIFIVEYLQKENIDHFLELDRAVYSEEYWVSKEATLTRIGRNNRTDLTVMHNNKMVGYISLCPVPSTIFKKIINNTITEEEIETHTVSYQKIGHYQAYLSSIVVDKKSFPFYRGEYLFHCLQEHINKLRKHGIYIDAIVAHAVSNAGRHVLEKFKFKEIKPNLYLLQANFTELTLVRRKHNGLVVFLTHTSNMPVVHWGAA
ncbi:hypothetical protein CN918_26320 [Priestia megaterium]|nr:hypothetical protein CN918_26320 [Priestia megaterium]